MTTASRWRRGAGIALAGVVASAAFSAGVAPASAEDFEVLRESNEECVEAMADDTSSLSGAALDNCLTQDELADIEAADDGVPLPNVGDQGSSRNLKLLKNLPKDGPLASGTNSDLAFKDDYAFSGNYNGFAIYDISNPRNTELMTTVACPGSQNDISVYGDLLFLSTDSVRTDDSCASGSGSLSNPDHWEGMKIFDISDVQNPEYIKSVRTRCGSHTHTLVPDDDGESVYIYVSSYSPRADAAYCVPPHDKISIIDVPLAEPTEAAVVAEPVLFPDAANQGSNTSGCHDITAYPEMDLAAGACMGDGIIMDITDPVDPVIVDQVRDPNFAFWHSATFNNDGSSIIFTDELGGGGGATCNATIGPNRGANAIYTFDGEQMDFASYYKLPRYQTATENCVAHNGSLIPVPGKDIFVQSWYQGGVSVFDFTDPANPIELAWFDRGPLSATQLQTGGAWSTYYYNGFVYTNEIARGFDVMELTGSPFTTAKRVSLEGDWNVQTQQSYPERTR